MVEPQPQQDPSALPQPRRGAMRTAMTDQGLTQATPAAAGPQGVIGVVHDAGFVASKAVGAVAEATGGIFEALGFGGKSKAPALEERMQKTGAVTMPNAPGPFSV